MDGGKPVRSRDNLRIRVSLVAWADGGMFSFSSRERMKRSRSLRGQLMFLTVGALVVLRGTKDQCCSYLAPCSIHFLKISFSILVRVLFDLGGGITSPFSSLMIRNHASLFLRSPGTIACPPLIFAVAPSIVSRRRFALRVLGSKPWQEKHLSERIGLTSRLKDTSSAKAGFKTMKVKAIANVYFKVRFSFFIPTSKL